MFVPADVSHNFMFISPLPAKPKGTLGLRSVRLSVSPSVCPSIHQSVRISFPDFLPKRLQILTWFLACESITMIYRSKLSFVTLHWFLAKLRAFVFVNFSNQTVFWTFVYPKSLQILTWFLTCESVTMICRSSLSFFTLRWFLAKLQACDLVNFSNQTVFRTFFPKRLQILAWYLACKSITMIYRSSLSFVTLHWFLAKLRAFDLVNFSDQTVFRTIFLNACRYWPAFWHVSQSPRLTGRVRVSLCSIDLWRIYGPWTKYSSAVKQFSRLFFEMLADIWHCSQSPCFTDWVWVSLCSIDFWPKTLFFLNACRYWPDIWHVSQSPWITDRVWLSLHSIDFWRNQGPWT